MITGVPMETFPGERRVALVPAAVPTLQKVGMEILLERNAGTAAGYPDAEYENRGARIVERNELFSLADIILHVRAAGANPQAGIEELELLRAEQTVIGFLEPLWQPTLLQKFAQRGLTAFALELMPRIARAQAMDALSSMATITGYKAVLLAANILPRMFPLLMTAAGSIAPARVFVIGAGVAGLQAIATARRLGGVVQAYDVRPAVKTEVQSVGARFVELPLEAGETQDTGGYALKMDEEFYRRQRKLMSKILSQSEVVISSAAIPGKRSPILITSEMVAAMPFGSVIVDLAAERGGNCQLTQPDETVVYAGVTILGPTNLPATVPFHASQMLARNISTFLMHIVQNGKLQIDPNDPIIRETLVARGGQVVYPQINDWLKEESLRRTQTGDHAETVNK